MTTRPDQPPKPAPADAPRQSDGPAQAPHLPLHPRRPALPILLAAAALGLAPLLFALVTRTDFSRWDREGGPVEIAQLALWAAAAVVGVACAWRIRDRAACWFTAWLSVMALLAGARELDLHELANPETLGAWGVRYRIDWWLDFDVPLWPKLLWAALFATIGTAIIFPLVRAWPTLWASLRARPTVVVLGIVSAIGLALGWFLDDILRPVRQATGGGAFLEETAELLGAWAYASAIGLLVWRR